MRRLALVLSALAFLACAAASIYALSIPFYQGIETVQTESGSETIQVTKRLAEVNGNRVVYLLAVITLASGMPLLAALLPTSKRRVQSLMTWGFALLITAFSILGSLTIGLLFMPGAILLLMAAVAALFIREGAVR